jgi:aryl-alcohol dehydrogenase-like predicted oxidoreductase
MSKFDGRTKGSALSQLDQSLQRLGVDHLDLWQFHENIRLEDPDRFFADGGAHEAKTEAKKAGKVRYVGFTGHKDPSVHLRMLELAEKHRFEFDTVQMPLNVMDAHFRSFGKEVLPVLVRKNIGVLGQTAGLSLSKHRRHTRSGLDTTRRHEKAMAKIIVHIETGKVMAIEGIPVDIVVEVRNYDVQSRRRSGYRKMTVGGAVR